MGWRGTALEVNEDAEFQRRDWRRERVSWAAAVAVLVAAVLGLFSTGPVSWAEARSDDDGLRLAYERFSRRLGESSLTASVRTAPGASAATLVVAGDYLDANEVQQIRPQPKSVVVTAAGVEYTFAVDAPGERVDVQFHVTPDDIGLQDFSFSVPGGQPVRVWQFMYP